MIDGHAVCARYKEPAPQRKAQMVDPGFRSGHIRSSKYFLQIVKCSDTNCCKPFRSNYAQVFPDRFLLPPIRYVNLPESRGPEPADPEKLDGSFLDYPRRCALRNIDPVLKTGPLPFDYYCPSVRSGICLLICPKCGVYEPSKEALKCKNHVCSTGNKSVARQASKLHEETDPESELDGEETDTGSEFGEGGMLRSFSLTNNCGLTMTVVL